MYTYLIDNLLLLLIVGRGFFFYIYLIQSNRPYREYKEQQKII